MPLLFLWLFLLPIGIAVADNASVQQLHGAGGIFFSQLRVMGYHDYQPILGDFLKQLHDLYAGLAV